MRSKLSAILPGLFLILAGAIALWAQLGHFYNNAPQFWTAAFGGFGVLFLVAYFLSGVRAWGWLFPAFICGALALTIYLGEAGVTSSIVGAPILVAIGLPFVVPLILDVRKNWWAIIPIWVMGVLAGVVAVADTVQGEWIAALVMLGFAIPFLVVFLTDRSRWWALIPAFVFAVIAFVPILSTNLKGEYIGGMINILIGLPFLVAYIASRKAWWGIIPAGVMISIGLMIILIGIFGESDMIGSMAVGVMFLGFAATFGLLWLRRDLHPADWAKYPAVVLAILAVFMFFSAQSLNYAWPIILIAGGLLLLYFGFRRKSTETKI
ncbi:MAG: hypothetical protein M1282_08125 [Chloroflexi bacterium]|nr:hypothetical protein [Chloroflexota bacterium]